MSISIGGNFGPVSGGVSIGPGGVSGLVTVAMPPFPAVLPFPGVPPLAVGFGASLGLPGGQIAGGFAVGPGGVSGGLGGSLGPVSGGINFGPGGVSGGAAIGIPGIGGGSVSITPEGITGNFGVGIGGLSVSLSGSLTGGVNPFGLSIISSLPPLLTQDQAGSLFLGPTWGIFDQDGQSIAPWDTVIKLDYRHDMRIADFPIEGGDFASYNKVQVPYDVRISFAVGSGGGPNRRTQFLASLEQAVGSLEFYTVATPEATYYRANLTHMEYSRETRRGVNLLVVDVFVSEVRPAEGAAYADAGNQNPQSPVAKGAASNGQSQALPVPPTPPPPDTPPATMSGEPQPGAPDPAAGGHTTMPSMLPGEPTPPPPSMPTSSAPGGPGGTSVTPVAPSGATGTVAQNPGGGAVDKFTSPDPTALY